MINANFRVMVTFKWVDRTERNKIKEGVLGFRVLDTKYSVPYFGCEDKAVWFLPLVVKLDVYIIEKSVL